jgi:hypothetical protein
VLRDLCLRCELVSCLSSETPFSYEITVASGHKGTDPEIDAYVAACSRQWLCRDVHTADRNEPASSLTGNSDRLRCSAYLTVEPKLHNSDPVEVKSPPIRVQAPTACVLPLDRVETSDGLEPREPRSLTRLDTPVESTEGSIETFQGPLANRYSTIKDLWPNTAQLSQGPALVEVRHRASFPLPRAPSVLEAALNSSHWWRSSSFNAPTWRVVGWRR